MCQGIACGHYPKNVSHPSPIDWKNYFRIINNDDFQGDELTKPEVDSNANAN